ncbi:MAG: TlyA family RNA methyltransferase [Puniceicoccales bacterium]|nr:TlyA family RNA methyltransferase [Puniceicoccales bacterium]
MEKPRKVRADELLVLQNKAPSRSIAKALVMSGKVRVGPDSVVGKPSDLFPIDAPLSVAAPPPYVSRGGEKLAAALRRFQINPAGLHALDIGASTGGFTDCLLQNGAAGVVCVDVGRAQLHPRLRSDPRVTNLEKINARLLDDTVLPLPMFGIVVMDLSFISLRKVLAPAWRRVARSGWLVALIKPQFEAGKAEVDKGRGVIRDPQVHERVVREITEFASKELPGIQSSHVTDSPIEGGDGNREFLFAAQKAAPPPG